MPAALVIAPPLILAVVLFTSGIGKLREPDDLAGWAELGVPASLRRPVLLRLHPWGELALALALALLGGILGLLAALACLLLMAAYLWLVWRAVAKSRAQEDDPSCACFGSKRPVTTMTVVRNAWLVVLSIAALAGIWTTPLLGGVVAAADATTWTWIVAGAAAALTAVLILWPESEPRSTVNALAAAPTASAPGAEGTGQELDYVRTRTPAVPVTLANGSVENLRNLARLKPILLMAVSETCSACAPVLDAVPRWRSRLPEVDIRLLVTRSPEESNLTQMDEPQSLHDTGGYVRGSIADWHTPAAVLLGADGFLAGGPVAGFDEISGLVGDIRASLDEL